MEKDDEISKEYSEVRRSNRVRRVILILENWLIFGIVIDDIYGDW